MDPITIWMWSLAAGGLIILVVALLLIAIIVTARSIDAHALEIWTVGKNIAANTVSIWMLNRTNHLARQIADAALSVDGTLKSLAEKLAKEKAT
jgi:hypothetical protein